MDPPEVEAATALVGAPPAAATVSAGHNDALFTVVVQESRADA
jgi:hypothetical protein